jgi:hypothetical protein
VRDQRRASQKSDTSSDARETITEEWVAKLELTDTSSNPARRMHAMTPTEVTSEEKAVIKKGNKPGFEKKRPGIAARSVGTFVMRRVEVRREYIIVCSVMDSNRCAINAQAHKRRYR